MAGAGAIRTLGHGSSLCAGSRSVAIRFWESVAGCETQWPAVAVSLASKSAGCGHASRRQAGRATQRAGMIEAAAELRPLRGWRGHSETVLPADARRVARAAPVRAKRLLTCSLRLLAKSRCDARGFGGESPTRVRPQQPCQGARH